MMEKFHITSERLNPAVCSGLVTGTSVGGTVVFIGTVRDSTKNKKVLFLEFECFEEMALKEMRKIADECIEKWKLHDMSIHHRIGRIPISEEAVVIAASAPHRKEAFTACEYAIDTLKKTVPIWKKEVFDDGEVWVSAHP